MYISKMCLKVLTDWYRQMFIHNYHHYHWSILDAGCSYPLVQIVDLGPVSELFSEVEFNRLKFGFKSSDGR